MPTSKNQRTGWKNPSTCVTSQVETDSRAGDRPERRRQLGESRQPRRLLSAPGNIASRIAGVRYCVTLSPGLGSSPNARALEAPKPAAIARTKHPTAVYDRSSGHVRQHLAPDQSVTQIPHEDLGRAIASRRIRAIPQDGRIPRHHQPERRRQMGISAQEAASAPANERTSDARHRDRIRYESVRRPSRTDVLLDKDGSVWYSDFGELFISKFDPEDTQAHRISHHGVQARRAGG